MNEQKIKLLIKDLSKKINRDRILENELLSKHTTFRIGGPARLFIQVKDLIELEFTINEAKKNNIPFFVMGGGTNLIVDDKGFNGLVVKNNSNGISIKKYHGYFSKNKIQNATAEVEVASGVPINQLVRFTLDKDLTGLEAFLGQPGTVGGAMYINAHNMKMAEFFGDKVITAKILTEEGKVVEVDKTYFKFGYDVSILQKRKDIVLSVIVKLKKDNHSKIWEKANKAMEHRKISQPLGIGSSGCTFRNISKADALRIGTPNGIISAGYLIEAVGLKNYQIGGAKFSDKHANFIINVGSATSKDVAALISLARRKIKRRFGVDLLEEVVWIN